MVVSVQGVGRGGAAAVLLEVPHTLWFCTGGRGRPRLEVWTLLLNFASFVEIRFFPRGYFALKSFHESGKKSFNHFGRCRP